MGWQAFAHLWEFIGTVWMGHAGVPWPSLFFLRMLVGWLPNLLFPAGVLLLAMGCNRSAMILGAIATLAAGIWLREYWSGLYVGYFVWLASMAILGIAGGCLALLTRRDANLPGRAEVRPPSGASR